MADYHKEPMVDVVGITVHASRRFLWSMAFTIVAVAAALIGLSIHSNHYGYFGPTGQFAFYNDRLGKAEYLAALPPDRLPDAFVIGSSNTMPILPKDIDHLLGVRSFNLGSFWGRAEDTWAWSNFLVGELGLRPKLVILGIEPWTFADDSRGPPLLAMYQRRLITTPQLAQYLPNYGEARAIGSSLLDSLTIENARLMAQMYARYKGVRSGNGPFPAQGFNADGSNLGYARTDPKPFLPEDVYRWYDGFSKRAADDAALNTLSAERRTMVEAWHLRLDDIVNFLPGDRMSPERLELFEKSLALLNEHGVAVAVLIMPTQPYYYDMLLHYTKHAQHLAALRERLAAWKTRYPNLAAVVDASHVARFGGSARAFHDHYHMTPDNTRLLLEELQRKMSVADSDAKQ